VNRLMAFLLICACLAFRVWAEDRVPIFQTYPGTPLPRERVANLMLAPGKTDIGFMVLDVDGKKLTGAPQIDSLELLPGGHVITVSSYTQKRSFEVTTTYYSNRSVVISFTAEAGHFYYLAVVDPREKREETLFRLKVVDLTTQHNVKTPK
jgi:hypothetical protein